LEIIKCDYFWITNVCYAIMDHTHKITVKVFLATSFGSRRATSGHKQEKKKTETVYIIGMEPSLFTLKDAL